MEQRPIAKVVVIGGGIAGLCAAHYLKRRGISVEIIEREKAAGGLLKTALRGDRYITEYGPSFFLSHDNPIQRLVRELSIDSQVIVSKQNPNDRFIFRNKKFFRFPSSRAKLLTGDAVPLLGRFRLMFEPFVKRGCGNEEAVAEFFVRRLGRSAYLNFVEPIITGLTGGDPSQLEMLSIAPKLISMENEKGKISHAVKGVFPKIPSDGLLSLKWGMGTISARLEEELKQNIFSPVSAEEVFRGDDSALHVRIDVAARDLDADAVIVATHAPEAARLLMSINPEIVSPLMTMPYAPICVVHIAFKKRDLEDLRRFVGFVVKRNSGVRMLSCICSSLCFPARCREDEVLYTLYYGGALDPEVMDLKDEEMISLATADLSNTLGITALPTFFSLKRWAFALPQSTSGHSQRLAAIEKELSHMPGIFLCGSYFSGASLSKTISNAKRAVDRAMDYLRPIIIRRRAEAQAEATPPAVPEFSLGSETQFDDI
jgi:oxygen-dependent protoporphyrinogen oxidase